MARILNYGDDFYATYILHEEQFEHVSALKRKPDLRYG